MIIRGGFLDTEPVSYDKDSVEEKTLIKTAPDQIFNVLNKPDHLLESMKHKILPPGHRSKGSAREEITAELTRIVADIGRALDYLMKSYVSLPDKMITSDLIHPISPSNAFIDESLIIVSRKHNVLHSNVITGEKHKIYVFNYNDFKLKHIGDKTLYDKILDKVLYDPEKFDPSEKRINVPRITNNYNTFINAFRQITKHTNTKYPEIKIMLSELYDCSNQRFVEFHKVLYSFIFVNKYNLFLDLLDCIHDVNCHEVTVKDSKHREIILKVWDMIKSIDTPSIYYHGIETDGKADPNSDPDPNTIYEVAAQIYGVFIYSPTVLEILEKDLISLVHGFNFFSTYAFDENINPSLVREHPLLVCLRFITRLSKMLIKWRNAEKEFEEKHPNVSFKLTNEFTNVYYMHVILFAKNIMVNKVEQLNALNKA